MKKWVLIITMLIFSVTTVMAAANNGQPSINLKEAWNVTGKQKDVIFDHAFHQTNNECTACHATAEGGAFVPSGEIKGMDQKNAAHNFCWTCHTEKNVSVKKTCVKCHTGVKK